MYDLPVFIKLYRGDAESQRKQEKGHFSLRLGVSAVKTLSRAVRTETTQSKLDRIGLKAAFALRLLYQLRRYVHLDVDQLPALCADRVIVSMRHPVEPARAVAERDLGYVPGLLQEAKRVVNGRKADGREELLGGDKYLVRRQMTIGVTDHLKDRFPLLCKT